MAKDLWKQVVSVADVLGQRAAVAATGIMYGTHQILGNRPEYDAYVAPSIAGLVSVITVALLVSYAIRPPRERVSQVGQQEQSL